MHRRIFPFAFPGNIVPKTPSVPPPPLRGTSPERGRFIYGSIRESTLPLICPKGEGFLHMPVKIG